MLCFTKLILQTLSLSFLLLGPFSEYNMRQPITVAARSKFRTVFACSDTGVVSSNPTRGMDICVHSVFVFSVAALRGAVPHLRSPTDCVRDEATEK
jgi:hypothetical protein